MTNADEESARPDPIASAFSHAAFAALTHEAAPSLIVSLGPVRVLWANRPAAELFGAPNAAVLTDRLDRTPGGTPRPLSQLADHLAVGAAPRLQRLRFIHDLAYRSITVLCQRVEAAEGQEVLAIAVVGLGQPDDADSAALWRQPAPGFETDEALVPARARRQAPFPAPATPGETPSLRADLSRALGGFDQGRFVWRSDASGRLGPVEGTVFDALGAPCKPTTGSPLVDTIGAFDKTAAEHLATVLLAHQTFRGIEIPWPVAGGAAVLPIVLGASPWFLPGQVFAGYRGFGTFDLGTLRRRSPPVEAPVPDAAPAQPAAEAPAPAHDDGRTPETVADPLPAPPVRADPSESRFSAIANVVRLWPLGAARLILPSVAGSTVEKPDPSSTEDTLEEATEPAEFGHSKEHSTPSDQDPGPAERPLEAAEQVHDAGDRGSQLSSFDNRVPEIDKPTAPLSSSEHEAFAEIGRALAEHNSLADQQVGPVLREPEDDLGRNAAALVETTPAAMMVTRGRVLLFANRALLDGLNHPSRADFDLAVGTALGEQAPDDLEADVVTLVLPRHDGETLSFDAHKRPIRWNGEAARLWMLHPTPAEPAEAAGPDLALRALLDAAGDAVALIEGNGALIVLNRQGEQWFGRDRSRLAGESFALLLAPESRTAAAAMLSEVKGSPDDHPQARGDVTARSPDGPTLSLDMRLARVAEDRFSVVWRDMSALKRYERDFARARSDAERASDRQPELLAKLSHQLRTPLNAIIGFAEVMMDERFGPLGNDRYKDYLKDIHASGTHVMSLVNDLLDLSRIETGRHDLDLGAVDINRVIGECVADMQPQAHRDRIIVRTSFSPRQPMILADDRAARQIIGNLLSNAVKFNEPGGQVIVSTTTGDNGSVIVRIRDTGIGMTDKHVAAALEPFRQLAPAKHAGGTGLGLPLAKALVGANGASLSIRSRPGEGTMVEVTFQPSPTVARVPA